MRLRLAALAAALLAGAFGLGGVARAADCAGLAAAPIAGLEAIQARIVPAGSPAPLAGLPAFCRVTGEVRTSAASRIKVEVWLPEAGWNGRFLPAGWAFYAGSMNPNLMAGTLRRGYATATTDGGGIAGQASFLLHQPEKRRDWGERAWRETTRVSKALIAAYYGRPARYAYWNGGGGASRQGLKAIQTAPADYDAVAAGGLALDPSHFAFAQIDEWRAVQGVGLTPEHLPAIHRAALAACDAGDGARDGFVGDPERCRFDPAVLRCQGAASTDCLTEPQVAAVRRLYAPVINPRTKAVIFGPLTPGSELGWRALFTPEPGGFALDFFRYMVFDDAGWDHRTMDLDRDVAAAEQVDASINAVDPDLSAFVARGGKLLLWSGWADTAIPPSAATSYYRALLARLGSAARDSVRLYMVPGMGHFLGGAGADVYDLDTQAVIEAWREQGRAPGPLVAVHRADGVQDRTVLLCPYPQVARYGGRGDIADAANFACTTP